MSRIYKSSTELIGKTPLAELSHIEEKYGLKAKIYAKLEYFNPAGSVKDRVALGMIEKAEKDGKLVKNSVIVEPTSGNTGIGIAAVGVAKGYRVVIVMPETMSVERRKLIAAYGAEVVLSEGSLGMKGAIAKAEEIAKNENGIILGQFVNPANPEIHYKTTGPEIYADTDGELDFFVAGVGTGGTITGVGKYLKEKIPGVKIIAVEPEKSPVLSAGKSGAHGIQGIGAGFVPSILDTSVYDEVITVADADAYSFGRDAARTEGYLVGISSGAALKVAVEIASRPENTGKKIVVLFPDSGDRYLSTPLFAAENNR
ncbi:MAG: cysteine synthase A [Clostridia bacterium]|nr:cysteine synthase A [Clostridia bacterium]MDY2900694.1 cysteine synthase A [Christensenellaceae bacterium]